MPSLSMWSSYAYTKVSRILPNKANSNTKLKVNIYNKAATLKAMHRYK